MRECVWNGDIHDAIESIDFIGFYMAMSVRALFMGMKWFMGFWGRGKIKKNSLYSIFKNGIKIKNEKPKFLLFQNPNFIAQIFLQKACIKHNQAMDIRKWCRCVIESGRWCQPPHWVEYKYKLQCTKPSDSLCGFSHYCWCVQRPEAIQIIFYGLRPYFHGQNAARMTVERRKSAKNTHSPVGSKNPKRQSNGAVGGLRNEEQAEKSRGGGSAHSRANGQTAIRFPFSRIFSLFWQ